MAAANNNAEGSADGTTEHNLLCKASSVHVCLRLTCSILQAVYIRRSEVDANGSSRKASIRPKAKRYTSETLPDRELLILSMLTLWRADIWWYLDGQTDEIVDNFFNLCVSIYIAPADPAIRWSLGRTFRCWLDSILACPPDHPKWATLSRWVSEAGYVGRGPSAHACSYHMLIDSNAQTGGPRVGGKPPPECAD